MAAFSAVITKMEETMGESAGTFLGERKDKFIAGNVTLHGGGHPAERAVRGAINRCMKPGWYPGKLAAHSPGRPCQILAYQKDEIARVAMEIKEAVETPSSNAVRARLPRLTINKATGLPISRKSINRIFITRCYDENEEDPWCFLEEPGQEYLPVELKSRRMACGEHLCRVLVKSAWPSYVAIDPCKSLLPRTQARLDEQKHAGLRKCRWMSRESKKKGVNLRRSRTARSQASQTALAVHWTPIFARGKLRIYMIDPQKAAKETRLPLTLNDSAGLASFVRNVLPQELASMAREFGWSNLPRVLVHDKASYMVSINTATLNSTFSASVRAAGMRSWLGDAPATWLAPRWGDVYLHETVISHIRRLLDTRFTCAHPCETPKQFRQRLDAVQDHMNSAAFAAEGKQGLTDLAKSFRSRCEQVVLRRGDRIPT